MHSPEPIATPIVAAAVAGSRILTAASTTKNPFVPIFLCSAPIMEKKNAKKQNNSWGVDPSLISRREERCDTGMFVSIREREPNVVVHAENMA
jgi:hypothetical protein